MVTRTPTNASLLWLGALSLGFGLLSLAKAAVGVWMLSWCAIGTLLLVYGQDARRLWSPARAARVGAVVGAAWMFACAVVGARLTVALGVLLGCAGAGAAIAYLLGWYDRRILRALIAAHRAGEPLEPHAIAAVRTARRVVFEVAYLLAEWQRFDVVEQLAIHAQTPSAEALRRYYLALALHARGRSGEARAIVRSANQAEQGPFVQEQWAQLDAQIAIALGEAEAVRAGFAERCPVDHLALAARRRLVVADARAATGDLDAARAIVEAVAAEHGRVLLDQLRGSTRPIAPIAQRLIEAPGSPYR